VLIARTLRSCTSTARSRRRSGAAAWGALPLLVSLALATALSACGGAGGVASEDPITIGLLLPFTGTSSATASNLERAVLYARDRINAGRGVHGRPGWDEIESGLARLRAGADIYYSVLTGPMLLDKCGSRLTGVTSTWQVQSSQIGDRPD